MTLRFQIVIPALNAARSVGDVIRGCLEHGRGIPVVVVDDGSTDGTGDAAREAGAVVLVHAKNLGKGAALKTGFRHGLESEIDAVITLDADGQHRPSDLPLFIEGAMESEADLLVGSRRHLFDQMVGRRRGANRFSAWAISHAAGVSIGDSQSGYRVYSSRLLREVPIATNGFDAESEIIVRAGRRGFAIESVPIGLGFVDGLSTSHYRAVADTVKIAVTVARTWREEAKQKAESRRQKAETGE